MEIPLESRRPLVREMPRRVPPPSHRHAAPSGPWPWQNLDDPIPVSKSAEPDEELEDHWRNYPESQFPNWKADQVARSQMKTILAKSKRSIIYHVDVEYDGKFIDRGKHIVENEEHFEDAMRETISPKPLRLRAFFVENLSRELMQMLGQKFNVEPFFWTSSVNWIPARYQENVLPAEGDHLTVTLTFPRVAVLDNVYALTPSVENLANHQVIDTQRPLPLHSSDEKDGAPITHVLILDILALHIVRKTDTSTILSYHPTRDWQTTTATNLYSRVFLAGQSVYWQKIFTKSRDPTFVLLATLWYALYAWDEAFETLWGHIARLELRVISENNMDITQELHKIRAHLLHYNSLLEDFNHAIKFVQTSSNPILDAPSHLDEKHDSRLLLDKECKNLLTQIERLKMSRDMWDKRLRNAMQLVFSTVNIDDSKHMQSLTEAAVRDSAAMKQISYLTMVFLPASFAAGIFGMNIQEINPGTHGTLPKYFETIIPLTIATTWVIVAFQGKWDQGSGSAWKRFLWPFMLVQNLMTGRRSGSEGTTVA